MQLRTGWVRIGICLFLAMLWAAAPANGQEPTGVISGTIIDTSGAVIPNVVVTIGAARSATSNNVGLYSADSLLPGQI